MTPLEFIMSIIGSFASGWMWGRYRQDRKSWEFARSQMDRGTYWFDRYMMEVQDDWTPLTEDLKDEDING